MWMRKSVGVAVAGSLGTLAMGQLSITPALPASPLIAYDTSVGIHLIRPDGSGHRLLVPQRGARSAQWSPDGEHLAFEQRVGAAQRITRTTRIHVVRADGRGRRVVAQGNSPAWSPDGSEIFYRVFTGDLAPMFVLNLESGERRRLEVRGLHPERSATGLSGSVGSYPVGEGNNLQYRSGLEVATFDGRRREVVPLPWRPYYSGLPVDWSPRGEAIYNCAESGRPTLTDLCAVHPDTKARRRVSVVRGYNETGITFSPNGRRSAIAAFEGLYVTRPTGGVRWIVRNPGGGGSNRPFDPVWSPDS